MKRRDKIWAGKVSALIIFILEILSIIYQEMEFDYLAINSIVAMVEDARVFLTIVCISFGVIAMKNSPKAYGLMEVCVADIILINHLYSDKILFSIPERMKGIDAGVLFFGVIVIGAVFFVVYRAISEKKNIEKIEHNGANIINISLESENGKEKQDAPALEKKEVEKEQENVRIPDSKKTPNILTIIVYILCAIVICWGLLDYLIFNIFSIKISRPKLFNISPNYLYYAAIMCSAILIVLFAINIILKSFRKGRGKNLFKDTFKISAIAAIVGEIAFFGFADDIDPSLMMNWFLSAVSDNAFLVFLIPIIFFIILQTLIVIVLNIIGLSGNSKVAEDIENRINNIQKGIIKIAFGIIEGCVDLFDFIPDFFSTIGYLLLNKESEKKDEKDKLIEK